MANFVENAKSIIRGFSPIFNIFSQYEILISVECAVDSERNGVIISVVSCSIVEFFICRSHKNSAFNDLKALKISRQPTIHAMTKLFVPFCSAQEGQSADMNCLVFWAHCENG